MKVAQLLGSLNRGGTETLLLNVLNNVKCLEPWEVILIHRKGGSLLQDFRKSGVAIAELTPTGNKYAYIRKLRKQLINNKVNIVHAHQPIDAFYAYLACIGTNIKIVLTFHGYDYGNNKIARLVTNFIIHKTDSNIFVSNCVKKYYEYKYKLKNKLITLYNGVSQIKNAVNTHTNLRTDFSTNETTLILGTVGNFVQVREPLTICKFLNLLKLKGVKFHFFFIGAKDTKQPHIYNECYTYCQENNLSNNVTFLGSRNDVSNLLIQLDAFLYSSAHDTFGIAVVEAIMMGIPVFVNDWQVMTEITENGKYANIYQSKNEQDLLSKFEVFLVNQIHYKQKANINAEIVKKKYSIENHILGLKEVYSNLIKANA